MLHLSEEQIDRCRDVWNHLVKSEERHSIDYLELKSCLEKLDIEFEHMNVFHKLLTEIEQTMSNNVTFNNFLKIYQMQIHSKKESNEEDTIDAFIAMGGNYDKSGQVNADKLIGIIKEF